MSDLNSGTTELLARVDGHIAILSFNRPESLNALSQNLLAALGRVIPQIADNPNIRLVVITGEGNAFCAGGDVKGMDASNKSTGGVSSSMEERIDSLRLLQNRVSLAIRQLPQPVVAVLPGAAAGAGLSIALAADLRIAAENAIILTAFSNIGASGDFGTSWFLPRLVGESRAKELMFTSPRLSAAEAKEYGIINVVLPNENFAAAALQWCHDLSQRAPVALRYMKENVNRAGDVSLQQALDAEAVAMMRTMSTADHREAAAAFVEKRPAKFTGQ